MRTISLSMHLDVATDRIWAALQQPALMQFVAHPMLRFDPIDPPTFPETWQERDYTVRLTLCGIVPLGQQVISITRPAATSGAHILRDNGHSALIRTWDHSIIVRADGTGTQYTDRISVDAGVLTPAVAAFVKTFFAHRQKRLRKLVSADFEYGAVV